MSFYGSDCPAQLHNPQEWWKDGGKPAVVVTVGDLKHTWQEDRERELTRRLFRNFYKVKFPRRRIPIMKPTALPTIDRVAAAWEAAQREIRAGA